ncbi:RHS repeat-associated core domain-containing protein [Andreprevotia sp. IGB-42]|uniref:RHS repeat-associated core domain-containing protein n=1 Tax=Andreprevotia sp. IGB-42 TaxID=2497473 RepID=UPI001F1E5EAE|nr:RHS repeat-associated core domain-containing protein [Andreprevotia sp. IGB-42]
MDKLDDSISAGLASSSTPAASTTLQQRLERLQTQLQTAAAQQEADFAATEAMLQQQKLPAIMLERHRAAVQQFRTQNNSFTQRLQQLIASKDDSKRRADLKALRDDLRQWRGLPAKTRGSDWGKKRDNTRAPIETPAGFKRQLSLFGLRPLMVAGPIPAGTVLPEMPALPALPTAADLAETEEAPQTAEIKALAAQLGNSPVRIHNWVRNQIAFIPSYGLAQGAAQTLRSRQGNAFDTASLELALLRAAGIATRYSYGTVEVPAAAAQRWLNVRNTASVISLLQQGGVPFRTVESAGQVTALRLEHVWLEAYVDYVPSRGAVNRKPNTWVVLDASFKPVEGKDGLDLASSLGFNGRAVLDGAQGGARCTAEGAGNLNMAALQSAYADFGVRLDRYAAQLGADATVQDLLGQRLIQQDTPAILYGTLPYTVVAEAGKFTAMPASLKWHLHFALYANAANRSASQAVLRVDTALAAQAGQSLALSFVPATQADADAIAALMPATGNPADYPAALPAYLIKVKAELRQDGQLLATGGEFTLGDSLIVDSALDVAANGAQPAESKTIRAGETTAIVVDSQGLGQGDLAQLDQRLKQVAAGRAAGSAELLHQIGRLYFANADLTGRFKQKAGKVVEYRMPSLALVGLQTEAVSAYGVVTQLKYRGIGIDIPVQGLQVAGVAQAASADYLRQSWISHAALASRVLAQVLGTADQGYSPVSVPGILSQANQGGQTVRLFTAANIAGVNALGLDDTSKADIRSAAQQGRRILTTELAVGDALWRDNGYVAEDPASLASSFTLAGTQNQAFLAANGGLSWLAWGKDAAVTNLLKARFDKARALQIRLSGLVAEQDGTRWAFHTAKNEVTGGLFLAGLSQQAGSGPCDWLSLLIAGQITANGGDNPNAVSNAAPMIQSQPVIAAQGGRNYRYQLVASDADGDVLSYKLISAPGGVSFSPAGLLAWDKAIVGSYPIVLRVDDGKTFTEQRFTLTVGAEALPLDIGLGLAPSVIDAGASTTISASSSGGSGTAQLTLTINGTPATLDAKGQLQWQAPASGAYKVVLTAKDGQETQVREAVISVRDASDSTAPAVSIASPVSDSAVSNAVVITGSVSDSALAYYKVMVKPADSDDNAWREIGKGYAAVSNGQLGRFDPTGLPNGWYKLAVFAYDVNGQQGAAVVNLEVIGDAKIGQFSLSFVDLDIDAMGIPVRVTRTYDTRRKAEALDFGYGWTVDYQAMQVRSNITLGLNWEIYKPSGSLELCVRSAGPRRLSVNIPGLPLQRFEAALAQPCAFGQVPPVDLKLNALPGTTSQLAVVLDGPIEARGGHLYNMGGDDGPELWDPSRFKLTTQDGLVYELQKGVGITRVTDAYGNHLDYTRNGLIHSAGVQITFQRDAQGRIIGVTDPAGKALTYSYDARGDLVKVTDRLKQDSKLSYNRSHGLVDYTDPRGIRAVRYEYDDLGKLIAVIDADGKRTDATHDEINSKEVIKDRRGYTTTYVYDANGNITSKTDALGFVTTYGYDANGNEAVVTDPLGHITRKDYHPVSGAVTKETDARGFVTIHVPDERGNIKQSTDPLGRTTTTTWVGSSPEIIDQPGGRRTRLFVGDTGNLNALGLPGQTLRYGYNSKGQKTSETDAASIKTDIELDANGAEKLRRTYAKDGTTVLAVTKQERDDAGRVTQDTDALGRTTGYVYNGAGKVSQQTDAAGRITKYDYDAQARLIRTTYPDGRSETQGWDAENNLISNTDVAGRTTRMEYDALNRLSKTIYPDGSSESQTYDPAGRQDSSTDRNGKLTKYEYDAAGHQTAIIDPLNRRYEYTYDAVGNRETSKDPDGKVTTYKYDDADRLYKTIYPDNTFTLTDWRADGRKQSDTDAKGNVTTYGYDAALRLNQVTQTDSSGQLLTQYGYDELGQKVSQTDAQQHTTRWTYDAAGQLKTRTLPDGKQESFDYDKLGRRSTHTDFNGKTTTWTYDASDRIASRLDGDGKSSFYGYTASGQVNSIKDARGETRWQFDAADRPTLQTNPDGSTLAWSYDNAGQIATRSTAAGTVKYGYDANGLLTTITAPDGKITTQTWDSNKLLASITRPNGTQTDYQRDSNGRITQIAHKKGAAVLGGTGYQLDADGKRLARNDYDSQSTLAGNTLTNPARTVTYKYDPLNRLKEEAVTDLRNPARNRTTGYSYDAVGNRKTQTLTTAGGTSSKTYDYDERDRLKTITSNSGGNNSTTTYSWDDNGNLLQKTAPGSITRYGWDGRNRLIDVKQGSSEQNLLKIATYQYDDNGNRVAKTDKDGKTTAYLIDEQFDYAQAVLETNNGNRTSYLFGSQLLAQTSNDQGSYYHADALGSTQQLSDANGNASAAFEYGAFGEPQTAETQVSGYLYTGEYREQDTGLQYNRARWYDAESGRFISQDTFAGSSNQPLTLNKYLYANADPANSVDPSGYSTTLNGEMTAVGMFSSLVSSAIPVFTSVTNVTAGRLLAVFGASVLVGDNAIFNQSALDKARDQLQKDVMAKAAALIAANKVIYHYTNAESAMSIFTERCIMASRAYYGHPDGANRPSGAYATHFPPWFPRGTVADLRAFLYAKRSKADVSSFVAIFKDPAWQDLGSEVYKRGSPGECINVDPIMIGPNLWAGAGS